MLIVISETSDISHAFLSLTAAKLSTFKSVFLAHSVRIILDNCGQNLTVNKKATSGSRGHLVQCLAILKSAQQALSALTLTLY